VAIQELLSVLALAEELHQGKGLRGSLRIGGAQKDHDRLESVGPASRHNQNTPSVAEAPEVLARIYNAEANFQQPLARLEERTRLWHEFNQYRAAANL